MLFTVGIKDFVLPKYWSVTAWLCSIVKLCKLPIETNTLNQIKHLFYPEHDHSVKLYSICIVHIFFILSLQIIMLNIPSCKLCQRNHPLKYWVEFQPMTPSKRRAHVKRHSYCLNCFAQRHNHFWCEPVNRCKICGARHHTMLYEEGREKAASSFEKNPRPSNPPNLPGT